VSYFFANTKACSRQLIDNSPETFDSVPVAQYDARERNNYNEML